MKTFSTNSAPLEKVMPTHPTRCLIWYWGTGGAGIRLAHRIAEDLHVHLGKENIAFSLHSENPWRDKAAAVSDQIDLVSGVAGRDGGIKLFTSLPSRFIQFFQQIRSFKADVIIIPMNFAQVLPIAIFLKILRRRLIYVIHDAAPHPGDFAPLMQRLTQWGNIRLAHQIVFFSQHVARELSLRLPLKHQKTASILNFNKQLLTTRQEARTLKKEAPMRFLFLGRLLRYKGLDLLAEACDKIKDRDDWCLTIAGDGPESSRVKDNFSRFKQVDISQLGPLAEAEVDRLIACHDVLLCPYLEASQSGVIPEAFAAGLPAIVTPVGALPEQIGFGRAGWIATATTSNDFANAIQSALDQRHEYPKKSAQALKSLSHQLGQGGWLNVVEK